jgi:hypothetical protein
MLAAPPRHRLGERLLDERRAQAEGTLDLRAVEDEGSSNSQAISII